MSKQHLNMHYCIILYHYFGSFVDLTEIETYVTCAMVSVVEYFDLQNI